MKEGNSMRLFEIIMFLCFDISLAFVIANSLRKNESGEGRVFSAVMGVGMLLGTVRACIENDSCALLFATALGFMLSYAAFLFSLPRKVNI